MSPAPDPWQQGAVLKASLQVARPCSCSQGGMHLLVREGSCSRTFAKGLDTGSWGQEGPH